MRYGKAVLKKGEAMKRLFASLLVLGMFAFAAGNFSISGSVGYSTGIVGGVEATWDCQLYQPGKGRLRPTIDIEYGSTGVQGAALMRHLFPIGKTGLGVGGGVGLRYDSGIQAYLRGDLMFRMDKYIGYPVVLGADVGYAYGFGGAPQEVVAHLKAGYCFEF